MLPCTRDVVVLRDLNFCAVPAPSSVLEGLACFVMDLRSREGCACVHCVQPKSMVLEGDRGRGENRNKINKE